MSFFHCFLLIKSFDHLFGSGLYAVTKTAGDEEPFRYSPYCMKMTATISAFNKKTSRLTKNVNPDSLILHQYPRIRFLSGMVLSRRYLKDLKLRFKSSAALLLLPWAISMAFLRYAPSISDMILSRSTPDTTSSRSYRLFLTPSIQRRRLCEEDGSGFRAG